MQIKVAAYHLTKYDTNKMSLSWEGEGVDRRLLLGQLTSVKTDLLNL